MPKSEAGKMPVASDFKGYEIYIEGEFVSDLPSFVSRIQRDTLLAAAQMVTDYTRTTMRVVGATVEPTGFESAAKVLERLAEGNTL